AEHLHGLIARAQATEPIPTKASRAEPTYSVTPLASLISEVVSERFLFELVRLGARGVVTALGILEESWRRGFYCDYLVTE
ncbi:hypothetical protein, partial [Glutamicibacter ardleyensis]|uniref:hypothetical protein n=1 Tax=Glutamicibacter ardleyensis TaxID=225894 RepID=UPI003FD5AEBE